jgi:hypothetical protein
MGCMADIDFKQSGAAQSAAGMRFHDGIIWRSTPLP